MHDYVEELLEISLAASLSDMDEIDVDMLDDDHIIDECASL